MWIVIAVLSAIAVAVGGFGFRQVHHAADNQPTGMMGLVVPLLVWGAAVIGGLGGLAVSGVVLAL
jgi:hypothetical protein